MAVESDANPENKLRGLPDGKPKKKAPIGVVYIVYNTNASLTTEFINNTLTSARSVRAVEPGLPITLIASPFYETLKPQVKQVFTDFIPIPNSILYPGHQWLTRIQAFSLTPYKITVSLDTDTFVCAPFSKDIQEAFKTQKLDLVFNGHDDYDVYPTHPDNGILAYKYSDRFMNLLKIWYLKSKPDKGADDQGPLKSVLLDQPTTWKVGRLSPAFGTRVRPAEGEPWEWPTSGPHQRIHDHTLVLSGPVRILHAFVFTYYNAQAVCDFVNQRTEPRVVLFNRNSYPLMNASTVTDHLKLAYSLDECHSLLEARCSLSSDWKAVPPIVSLNEALRAIIQ
jgi:hypothetical protein